MISEILTIVYMLYDYKTTIVRIKRGFKVAATMSAIFFIAFTICLTTMLLGHTVSYFYQSMNKFLFQLTN